MNTNVWVKPQGRHGYYANVQIPDSAFPKPQPVAPPVHVAKHHGGLIAGALVLGIFALCPASLRFVLVLIILAGLGWLGWRFTEQAQQQSFRLHPAAGQIYESGE
jgi:hypothetical protein